MFRCPNCITYVTNVACVLELVIQLVAKRVALLYRSCCFNLYSDIYIYKYLAKMYILLYAFIMRNGFIDSVNKWPFSTYIVSMLWHATNVV